MTFAAHRWMFTAPGAPLQRAEFVAHAGAGEVVVAVAGCGVCHTDLGYYYDGVRTNSALPLTLGHEISGHVVAAGAGAEGWLGKAVIVTDAPALRETGSGADVKVLGLVSDAAIVHDAGDLVSNIETTNGKLRIETTMQVDYSFGLGLKGYAWDTANGGKSPTDAEIATGSNWDKVATSIKHTAGVLALGPA